MLSRGSTKRCATPRSGSRRAIARLAVSSTSCSGARRSAPARSLSLFSTSLLPSTIPWAVAVKHADAAGVALARKLLDRPRPRPPVTLVGCSVGARLVMRCLEEIADSKADGAHAVVENVFFLGAPLAARPARFRKARTVVSGRLVNAYSTRDWMLNLVYRSKAWSLVGVAGATPIPNSCGGPSRPDNPTGPELENLDLSDLVNGHLAYPHVMPQILARLKLDTAAATLVLDDPCATAPLVAEPASSSSSPAPPNVSLEDGDLVLP